MLFGAWSQLNCQILNIICHWCTKFSIIFFYPGIYPSWLFKCLFAYWVLFVCLFFSLILKLWVQFDFLKMLFYWSIVDFKVFISAVQSSDSVLFIYRFFSVFFFHYAFFIGYWIWSLCYAIGLCCLSILYIMVCIF